MKQYLAAVEAMVRSKFEQRKPNEIRAELRRLRRKFKPEKEGLQEAKKILKLVENELQDNFIVRFTKDFADEQFENLSNRFDDGVLKAVRRAMKSQNSTETAVKLVKRLGNVNKRYIDTVVQTAKGGIAQAQKIEDAKKANIKYFRYEGPIGGSRAFCANLVGKVFSLDEILAMVGQNGLPVLYFGGGWNCRHRWVAVDGRFEDGVFINKGFDVALKNTSKNEAIIIKKELVGAKQLSKFGSVEISDYRKTENVPDADIRFNGEFVQLKQPETNKVNTLKIQLSEVVKSKQNNNVIVIVEKLQDEEKSIRAAKEYMKSHPDLKLRVLNLKTNEFFEVKNEKKRVV